MFSSRIPRPGGGASRQERVPRVLDCFSGAQYAPLLETSSESFVVRWTIADVGLLSCTSHCWDDVRVGARGQVCADALTDACCLLPACTLLDFSHSDSFRLDVLRRNNSSYARQCSSASAVGRFAAVLLQYCNIAIESAARLLLDPSTFDRCVESCTWRNRSHIIGDAALSSSKSHYCNRRRQGSAARRLPDSCTSDKRTRETVS